MTDTDKNAKFLVESSLKMFNALKSLGKAIELGVEAANVADDILKKNPDKQWVDKCMNMICWVIFNIKSEFDAFTQLISNPETIAVEQNSSMGELQQALTLFKNELRGFLNG